MFENGRKTIGVILCDVSSHYQEQICQTLSMYAKEADYNLAYFTFFVLWNRNNKKWQRRSKYCSLDSV